MLQIVVATVAFAVDPQLPQVQAEAAHGKKTVILLSPIQSDVGNISQADSIGGYLGVIMPFIVTFIAMAAVVQLVVGGFEYALSESITNKGDAKDRMQQALLGLLLALTSYLILRTINPDLVKLKLELPKLSTIGTNFVPGPNTSLENPPNIAAQVSAQDAVYCDLGGGVCRTDYSAQECIDRGWGIFNPSTQLPCPDPNNWIGQTSPPFTCSSYVPTNPKNCPSTGAGVYWRMYYCESNKVPPCDPFSETTKNQYTEGYDSPGFGAFGTKEECEIQGQRNGFNPVVCIQKTRQ